MRSRKSYTARELSNASPGPLCVQILPIDPHIALSLSPCLSYIRGVLCLGLIFCRSQHWHDDLNSQLGFRSPMDLPGDCWAFSWPQSPLPFCPGTETSLTQNTLNSKLSKHHRVFLSVCAGNTWGFWWDMFCFVVLIYSTYKYEQKKIGMHKTHNA